MQLALTDKAIAMGLAAAVQLLVLNLREAAAIGVGWHLDRLTEQCLDEKAGRCSDSSLVGCDSDPRNSKPIHLGLKGKHNLRDLLLRYPNVVAYVVGHTHRNNITLFPHKSSRSSGFWQINTASHVDWAQQSRLIELMNNRDGTLSIFTTILDQAAPITPAPTGTNANSLNDSQLASISRSLALNDPQTLYDTDGGGSGKLEDRNTELILKDPRKLAR